ncbi:MAG: formyltetrahydrofolate deformylase [Verrucomicrobiota bacterium]
MNLIALLHGPDKPGIVSAVSTWIFSNGGSIIHADQHRDSELGIFFQRVEWSQEKLEEAALREQASAFREFARTQGMEAGAWLASDRPRVALFVSKQGHAFHDLMLRWQSKDLPCEIVAVIGNHDLWEETCDHYGVPFHHVAVTADTKPEAEAQQQEILSQAQVDFAVLARYMQVLSGDFLEKFQKPVINIHHSFLPAFAGARPYHQAHTRGVKLIGATAHYVTEVLDDGPIIHQAVERISHRHTVSDLVRKGQDLEKLALSQAVRWQVERRILSYANKTVVFD